MCALTVTVAAGAVQRTRIRWPSDTGCRGGSDLGHRGPSSRSTSTTARRLRLRRAISRGQTSPGLPLDMRSRCDFGVADQPAWFLCSTIGTVGTRAWSRELTAFTRRRRETTVVVVAVLALAFSLLLPGYPASAAERERVILGSSVEGRPIVAVHRWRPEALIPVLVIGSMHGPERAGLRVVRDLADRAVPSGVDLWTIRTMNPDGTAAHRRTNARGVDLNRNFPRGWTRAGASTPKFSGHGPASEPETQALMRLVREIQPQLTIVFHQPLYGVNTSGAKSMTLVRRLAAETRLPLKSFQCGGRCHGTFTMWHNARTPGNAVTVEFGSRVSQPQVSRVSRAVLRVAAGR